MKQVNKSRTCPPLEGEVPEGERGVRKTSKQVPHLPPLRGKWSETEGGGVN